MTRHECATAETPMPYLPCVYAHNHFDIHQKSVYTCKKKATIAWLCTQTIVTLHRQNKETARQPD